MTDKRPAIKVLMEICNRIGRTQEHFNYHRTPYIPPCEWMIRGVKTDEDVIVHLHLLCLEEGSPFELELKMQRFPSPRAKVASASWGYWASHEKVLRACTPVIERFLSLAGDE